MFIIKVSCKIQRILVSSSDSYNISLYVRRTVIYTYIRISYFPPVFFDRAGFKNG